MIQDEANLNLEVKVFKLNPDGSKGELIRIEPAFPEAWDTPNPRQILPQRPKKEDKEMPPAREDREEKTKQARSLMAQGYSMSKAARSIGVPIPTLSAWLKKGKSPKVEPKKALKETLIAPAKTLGIAIEPIPYQPAEALTKHHDIAYEIANLLDQKRQDYGVENIRKFGSYGVLVRVSDKVERLINLSGKGKEPNFETTEDTWKDIAGYAILALIELREGR